MPGKWMFHLASCASLLQDLREAVVSSLTNNAFMSLLEDGNDAKETAARIKLLKTICERFVGAYRADDMDQNDGELEGVRLAMQTLNMVFAGILVLLDPTPGVAGTDMGCISKLMDDDSVKQDKLVTCVKVVITSHKDWQKRLDCCLAHGASTMKLAPVLQDFVENLSKEGEDERQQAAVTDSLRSAVAKLPNLREALRPGATSVLESMLADRVKAIAAWTLEQTEASVVPAGHMETLLPGLELVSSSQGMLEMQSKVREWQGKMAKQLGLQNFMALANKLCSADGQSTPVPWQELRQLLDGIGESTSSIKAEHLNAVRQLANVLLADLVLKAGVFLLLK